MPILGPYNLARISPPKSSLDMAPIFVHDFQKYKYLFEHTTTLIHLSLSQMSKFGYYNCCFDGVNNARQYHFQYPIFLFQSRKQKKTPAGKVTRVLVKDPLFTCNFVHPVATITNHHDHVSSVTYIKHLSSNIYSAFIQHSIQST